MRITERNLKGSIQQILKEEEKPGSEKATADGNLNVKKIADTLGVDASKLSAAVKAAKAGKRNAANNAVLGDVFVKLMNAPSKDTVTVMNVLKAVGKDEKK